MHDHDVAYTHTVHQVYRIMVTAHKLMRAYFTRMYPGSQVHRHVGLNCLYDNYDFMHDENEQKKEIIFVRSINHSRVLMFYDTRTL